MKCYRTLVAPVRFGPGQKLHLSQGQIALRAHNLSVGELNARTGAIEVETVAHIEFKRGELIWLPPASVNRALERVLEFVRDAAPEPAPAPAPAPVAPAGDAGPATPQGSEGEPQPVQTAEPEPAPVKPVEPAGDAGRKTLTLAKGKAAK